MNVYDFDKTIYDGDSTFNFYKYCLKKKPHLIFGLWRILVPFIKYLFGKGTKTAFKEKIYESFLPKIDREAYLDDFWKKNITKIKKFYIDNKKDDDIIISASPFFIVKPCADILGIKYLYASNVDPDTGKYDGINCHGKEKVRRFEEAGFKKEDINEFYSDSLSDTPLAEISKAPVIVNGDELIPWNEYKPCGIFGNRFVRFMMCGGVSCLIGLIITYIVSHVLPDFRIDMKHFHMSNIVFAHFVGYLLSLPCSYVLNSKFSFKQPLSFKKCGKFCLSYVPNYIIQMLVVFVTVDLIHLEKLIGLALAVLIAMPVTFFIMKFFTFGDRKTKAEKVKNDNSDKEIIRKKRLPILMIFLVIAILIAFMCIMLFPKGKSNKTGEKPLTQEDRTNTDNGESNHTLSVNLPSENVAVDNPLTDTASINTNELYDEYAASFMQYRQQEANVFPGLDGSAATSIKAPDDGIVYLSSFSGGAPVIYIGSSVKITGSIKSLELPNSVVGVLSERNKLPESKGAFYGNTTLGSFIPAEGLKYIGNNAFYGCRLLSDVFLPMSLTHIGDRAFYGCRSLGEISIFGNCSVGDGAFALCSSLSDVYLSDKVQRVGLGAFEHTPFYERLTDEFCIVGDILIKYNGNKSDVVIPDGVRIIGDGVFAGRLSIESVSFPASIEYIGNSAFRSCAHLGKVVFDAEDALPSIGENTFDGCPVETDSIITQLYVDSRDELLTDDVAHLDTVH